MNENNEYWAELEDGDEFLDAIKGKISEFYQDVESEGISDLLQRCHRAYYGGSLSDDNYGGLFESSKIGQGGSQGKISKYKANHFRNVITYTLQLTTSQRPAAQARSVNTDYKSLVQTTLGTGLVDFYFREKSLQEDFIEAVETSCVLFEGWIHSPWNPNGGEVYDYTPENNAPVYEGDLSFGVYNLLDVVRDISVEKEHKWYCLRTKKNKWELAAEYPEVADDILEESTSEFENLNSFKLNLRSTQESDDNVTVWYFYHESSKALEGGRFVMFTENTVLYDGPIPYKKIPLNCIRASRILGTPYGYSNAADILAPQEALDRINSTILTNQSAFGIQSIWSRKGDNLSVTSLGEGMKHFESEEMPQPIQLTQTPAEVFNFRGMLINDIEQLSGINSTVRGQPASASQSGAAQALMVSQAIAFSSLLEGSYNGLIEKVGTSIINQLKDFAKTPRVASIVGEANRSFTREFTGDDLNSINRVVVEQANPMSKSISGRLELAKSMAEMGIQLTPHQFLNIVKTGSLDSAVEGTQHSYLNMRAENEDLREGLQVVAIASDNHAEHIKSHQEVIANPDSRRDPELVARTLAHIQEHINLWRNTDSAILMVTGQQPPPPAPPAPSPVNGASQAEIGSVQGQMTPPSQVNPEELPNQPNLPNLPDEAPIEAQEAYQEVKPTE